MCNTCGPLSAMSLMTCHAFPQFSVRAHLFCRLPHLYISNGLLRIHMPKSHSLHVLEPWASLFGAPESSTVPPSSQPLGLLLFPLKCPWNPQTPVSRCLPSGGPLLWYLGALTGDTLASTFPLPVLIGHRGQNVLSKRLLCACHHPAQKPPITASWAPSVLWSGTLPLPRLANLPFSIDLPLLCLLLAPARSVYSLWWVLVMNKTMVRLCQGPSLSGWDASARGLG